MLGSRIASWTSSTTSATWVSRSILSASSGPSSPVVKTAPSIPPGRVHGTLRFLALAVIELDPVAQGVLSLEEPENGIHPERIPAMLKLLKEIATATDDPIGPDNPLRQVIINTHSPAVVSEVDDDSLLFAQLRENVRDGQRFQTSSSPA